MPIPDSVTERNRIGDLGGNCDGTRSVAFTFVSVGNLRSEDEGLSHLLLIQFVHRFFPCDFEQDGWLK